MTRDPVSVSCCPDLVSRGLGRVSHDPGDVLRVPGSVSSDHVGVSRTLGCV